jgi:hypothetical protein
LLQCPVARIHLGQRLFEPGRALALVAEFAAQYL